MNLQERNELELEQAEARQKVKGGFDREQYLADLAKSDPEPADPEPVRIGDAARKPKRVESGEVVKIRESIPDSRLKAKRKPKPKHVSWNQARGELREAILTDLDLMHADKVVALFLLEKTNAKQRGVWWAIKKMAAVLKTDPKTVRLAVEILRRNGYIRPAGKKKVSRGSPVQIYTFPELDRLYFSPRGIEDITNEG